MKIKNKGHSMLELIIRWTITAIIAGAFMIGFATLLSYGSDNIDKQYCYKLQAQAEQYSNFQLSAENPTGFYITELDKEQCDHFNIIIKAPVR